MAARLYQDLWSHLQGDIVTLLRISPLSIYRILKPVHAWYNKHGWGNNTSPWRLFLNFFWPSEKLIEKKQVASKTVKRYDKPKIPYVQVLDTPEISTETKHALGEQYKILNYFELRKTSEINLKKIFKPWNRTHIFLLSSDNILL